MRLTWMIAAIVTLAWPAVAQNDENRCALEAPLGSTHLESKVWQDICTEGKSDPSKHIVGPCPGALLSRYESKSTRVGFAREITDDGLPDFGISNADVRERILSEKFLTTILTDPSYVAARPTSGVTLVCALIQNLNLEERNLEGSLRITDSFIVSASLRNTRIDGTLDLGRSVFINRLDAIGVEVRRDFKAFGSFFLSGLSLQDAKISGFLDLDKTTGAGDFDAQRISVGESFFLFQAVFVDANLNGADIGGDLNIQNADFSGYVNAERVRTGGAIFLRNKSKFAKVRLFEAQTGSNLETTGSSFSELFDASNSQIGGSVLLNDGASFADLKLVGAKIDGVLSANGSVFGGNFDAEDIKTGRSVFLRNGATFEEGINLDFADIGGNVETARSTFRGLFNADSIKVGGSLFLRNGAQFDEVNLIAAKIGGSLEAGGSTFDGRFYAPQMKVTNNVFLWRGATFENVFLVDANIGGHLRLEGSTFNSDVQLSEATIGSFLLWGWGEQNEKESEKPEQDVIWGKDATLSLRNTTAQSLQAKMGGDDASDGKPATDNWTRIGGSRLPVDLSGFRYKQLGGFSAADKNDLTKIDPDKLIHWVDNSKTAGMTGYRPQPYRALQTALQDMGAEASAKEVAYARLKHRANTRISASLLTEPLTFVGQVPAFIFDKFLQFTIGFGVYPRWAFYWFLGLVFVGYCVTRRWPPGYEDKETRIAMGGRFSRGDSIFYSLENAIPLMLPSRDHGGINHTNYYTRMFFHFQKVVGFLLASVLIGTLSFGV